MAKIKSLADLKKLKTELESKVNLREQGENIENLVQVRVAMATCGIAAGAKDTMNYMLKKLKEDGINNVVITQTGCMGKCHSEPTIEVILPKKEGVTFGNVDAKKAEEIIERYIKNGELVDGIIPVDYETID